MGGGYSGYRVRGSWPRYGGGGLPYWRVVVCANLPTFRLSSFSTCWEVGKLAGWVGGGTAGCERVSVMNWNDTAGGSPAVAAERAGSSSFTPG